MFLNEATECPLLSKLVFFYLIILKHSAGINRYSKLLETVTFPTEAKQFSCFSPLLPCLPKDWLPPLCQTGIDRRSGCLATRSNLVKATRDVDGCWTSETRRAEVGRPGDRSIAFSLIDPGKMLVQNMFHE